MLIGTLCYELNASTPFLVAVMSKAEVVTQSLTLPFDGIKLIDILKLELGLWVDDSANMSVCVASKSLLHVDTGSATL